MALKSTPMFVVRVVSPENPEKVVGYAVAEQVSLVSAHASTPSEHEILAGFEKLIAEASPSLVAAHYAADQDDDGHYVAFAVGKPPSG